MSAIDWSFTEAEQRADGSWRVVGTFRYTREYRGMTVDLHGMLVMPVEGVGDTPQAARNEAIYCAGQQDAWRFDIIARANAAVMGGS